MTTCFKAFFGRTARLLVCLTCLLIAPIDLFANEQAGKPFRILYVDGGSYSDFQRVFSGFAKNLKNLDLVENGDVPVPKDTESVREMWEWMGNNAKGEHIVFLPDGYYSAEYDKKKMETITAAIRERIKTRQDVDLILSFGTVAGQSLSKLDTTVPIIFTSVTDAVAAKIVPSVNDSGKDNHVAIIVPDLDKRSIEIFHRIFNFSKMGIAYENTPEGRDLVALSAIEAAAADFGIELIRCTDEFEVADSNIAADRLAACHSQLIENGAQAIFLTTNISITPMNADIILRPINAAKLPSFSQLGSADVKLGALMSQSEQTAREEGAYCAELLAQIRGGKTPRSLSQVFDFVVIIAINLRTAAHIGWNPSLETLLMVDEFYN
ncbi:MAG: ABC transporter substrate-binding protein [Desulfovibrionaceae bacterium]|nr:ABC transporter substrate-binding protein [Desulfovibrionaceae bacterium]